MRRWRCSEINSVFVIPTNVEGSLGFARDDSEVMKNENSLKPFWIGLGCMAIGVLLIYWAFHSGSKAVDETPTDEDDGAICAQVITSAKNPDTGEVVDYATPCDVPEGWEVVRQEVGE